MAKVRPAAERVASQRVLFIAPAFQQYPILIPSLLAQRHAGWELALVHDGPDETGMAQILAGFADPRVGITISKERLGEWGHRHRDWVVDELRRDTGLVAAKPDWIVHTNPDNYYVPGFCDVMLKAAMPNDVALYCPHLHNGVEWLTVNTTLREGSVDCGAFMVRREIALEIGWPSRRYQADWDYVKAIVDRYGEERFRKINRVLFVHN